MRASGFDTSAFTGDVIPTVYSFNWVKPDGLFFADRFQVRDHDQLVVSESPSTEILKFLNLTNSATTTAVNINTLR